MHIPLGIAAFASALVVYIFYVFLSAILISRRNAGKARELNCEEPPFQTNRYPFGIDQLLRALEADKAKQFPTDAIQRTVDTGSITYKYSLLGITNIFTADEKNVQAILATQFNDFGKLFFPPRYYFLLISCRPWASSAWKLLPIVRKWDI